MFTGLIKSVGRVKGVVNNGPDRRLLIETDMDMNAVDIGASVCCSGCCLTVVQKAENWFAVDVSAETLEKTTIGRWKEGTEVNLEPSLRVGDEIGGHFVSGHVDGHAVVRRVAKEGISWRMTLEVPQYLAKYIAPKGSVALAGVSLTVNEVQDNTFGVNIIPHTWHHTTLGQKQEGDQLNIEIDMLARYVERMIGVKP